MGLSDFFNQPLGFYVVGLPLLIVSAAFGMVVATSGMAIIGVVLAIWLSAMRFAVATIRKRIKPSAP